MFVEIKSWNSKAANKTLRKVCVKTAKNQPMHSFEVTENDWKGDFCNWFNDYFRPTQKLSQNNFNKLKVNYGIDLVEINVKTKKELRQCIGNPHENH